MSRYNLDENENYLANMIHHCYEAPVSDLNPRRLACLHMLLALGYRLDESEPVDSPRADKCLHYGMITGILHDASCSFICSSGIIIRTACE